LSEEYAKSSDIERLEERIDNLRVAVIVLIVVVSILSIHAVFQLNPQNLLLPFFAIGIFFLCLFLLANSCTKDNGAPAGIRTRVSRVTVLNARPDYTTGACSTAAHPVFY
jgi:hypothetical protein